ncbi:uncharacterized protein C8Q71DRAFT_775881 [Rhodofomes roseus]|uniref:RING-type domain-containing protein n=1 Tax=Rhodofomes roseus TaxID=34475 RepID=A0ABQ8K6X1_9APHY|nr:uncharacterized protein C8Q71DRAFT_775881 [Rhodofomes roseus]KAH9832986.1 hypothetical protein C8Q71DRAFT_775881 [Rhodofomes roseus]
MNAVCSICLDALNEEIIPVATRCGHLYCKDCADFNFARQGATCAICRQAQSHDSLIKLYPDYEQPESSHRADQQPTSATPRQESPDATLHSTELWGDRTLVDGILKGADDIALMEYIPEHERRVDLGNTLRSVRKTLQTVYSNVDRSDRIARIESEIRRLKREHARSNDAKKELPRLWRHGRKAAAAQLEREREDFQTVVYQMRAKLQRLEDDLRTTQDELRGCEETLAIVDKEMKMWRSSATRHKKKFHALKAQLAAHSKQYDTDDSLEIV